MGVNTTSPRTEVIHAVQNQYFNNTGGKCPTCKANTGVSAARFGDYKIILGASCNAGIVSWPELAPSPVPFGKTTGWVREGTNWAYAGLLNKTDMDTGLALDEDSAEGSAAFESSYSDSAASGWSSTHDLSSGAGPDPTCATGIADSHSGGEICCLKSCTKCGCPGGIPYGPGGDAGCCVGKIFKDDKPCSKNPPPCVLKPAGPTPAPSPKGKKVGQRLQVHPVQPVL
jgi:hypothetical protein